MRALLLAGVVALGWTASSEAAVIVNITQTATGVVALGGGTLDMTGLSLANVQTGSQTSYLNPAQSTAIFGPASGTTSGQLYSIGQQTERFGPVNMAETASSGSGDTFGVFGFFGFLIVPSGYTSGSLLSATDTFSGATFSSLGLIAGSYTFTLPNDTLTVNLVAPTTVPEPASLALLGMGVAGVAAVRRRRAE